MSIKELEGTVDVLPVPEFRLNAESRKVADADDGIRKQIFPPADSMAREEGGQNAAAPRRMPSPIVLWLSS